ncbi:hypothetical protein [Streptomyces xinghaiensis]|uniref:hypothetical protein n=1 Tax=Streptomyces xinghaiensis TaxID=1038928 RepID=UPI00341910FD
MEVHVDRSLEALVADSGLSLSPLGTAFLSRYSDDMSRSWDARYDWLADGFGVTIKGDKFQQDFHTLVEIRNAIVHGSGELTKRQQAGLAKFVQLRKRMESVVNVRVYGTRIVFATDSVARSLNVASDFVRGFDQSLLAKRKIDY